MSKPAGSLVIWTFGDVRIGIENQLAGLAEAIGEMIPATCRTFTAPKPTLFSRFTATKPLPDMQAPWPDIAIGCGRASLPFLIAMRRWSAGKTLSVQLQAPAKPLHLFDLVIAPAHDNLAGDNVLSIIGSTNRVSPQKLSAAKDEFAAKIDALTGSKLAVVLGGNSKRHKLTKAKFQQLCADLQAILDDGTALMISTSRRTPELAKQVLQQKFGDKENVWLWTDVKQHGDNPYFAFLAAADSVLVTSDSTNLLTEAASAAKPVLMLRLDGKDGKFSQLYESLKTRNNMQEFTGSFTSWPVEPLAETRRAAEEVLRRFHNHLNKP
ncbi:DUF1022 domain-containing protein [hydrothermal vent metagenome]|uniref:DUF1022 domain-containing protein n=1 Tax=hydrothermal vent metagenome TaxID=652676 RepID=A0A3B0SC20_9ZZZZ